MLPAIKLLPYAGWPLAALMFWFWLGARDQVIEERESCNADKLTGALESSELARTAIQESAERRFAELESLAKDANNARLIAEAARLEVESRPAQIRTVVREVASNDACLNSFVPVRVLDCVRSAEGCDTADSD